MNRLHPRVTVAWRFSGAVSAVILTAVVGTLETLLLLPSGFVLIVPGAVTGLAAIAFLTPALLWPTLRYRCWRWEVQDDRVVIQRGVIWRARSVIPRVRIQHVDTRSSPLQRWLDLASLVIYTAGTRGADAEIPGLATETAEGLREQLAELAGQDEPA